MSKFQVKPNFLIVGASKCGTTALFYYLKQHPDVSFPSLKEPKYFSSINQVFPHNGIGDKSVDEYAIKNYHDYLDLFKNLKTKRVGEASPDTLYFHKQTVPIIKKTLGDIPIIIVLRDPVFRAFSAYMYLKRDSREKLSFRDGLDLEDERLRNNWDFIWGYKKCGLYYEQVKSFLDNFTSVKIIFQEDLKNNTRNTIKDIFTFLKIDPNFKPNTSTNHNESGIPNNIISKFLLSRDNKISTIIRDKILKKYVPRKLLEKIASSSLKKETIKESERNYLKSFFKNDIVKLEKLISKNLSQWKP